jgi:hypothetical protein
VAELSAQAEELLKMSTMLADSRGLLVLSFAFAAVSCKGEPEAQYAPVGPQGGGAGASYAGAGGAPAAGAPAAAGATAAGAPAQGGAAGTPAATGTQKLDPTAGAAVKPILDQVAKSETQPGAVAVGETLVGNFATGGSLDIPLQLNPNKCYTIVAVGLPPVTDVNIQITLVTPLPGMTPVLAIDQETGPQAVLGKKATCYRWAFGMSAPAKVVVQVPGGSGLVIAQAYEK